MQRKLYHLLLYGFRNLVFHVKGEHKLRISGIQGLERKQVAGQVSSGLVMPPEVLTLNYTTAEFESFLGGGGYTCYQDTRY